MLSAELQLKLKFIIDRLLLANLIEFIFIYDLFIPLLKYIPPPLAFKKIINYFQRLYFNLVTCCRVISEA